MPDKPNTPEKRAAERTVEIDRYERLQAASERQIENIHKAYETHASLLRIVVISAAGLASVIVSIIAFGFYHSVNEFKQELRENLSSKITNMVQIVDDSITRMTNRVELKITEEDARIDAGIDQRFQLQNITPLIESGVRGKVDQVTSRVIEEAIHKKIDPQYADLTNEMVKVKLELEEARIAGNDVRGVLDLAMNIVMALSDDRKAFDQLVIAGEVQTNRYNNAIHETVLTIMRQELQDESPFNRRDLKWAEFNFNPDTNSFDDYLKLYTQLAEAESQSVILQRMSQQTRFPRYQKLSVYLDVIKTTPSIKVLGSVLNIVEGESQLHYNILGKPLFVNWLENEIRECAITNYTETLKTNKFDVMSYCLRAYAYETKSNFQAALKDVDTAVTLAPTNYNGLNAKAWILATCPVDGIRNGKQSIELAKRACELSGWKEWNCIGTLAAAYAENGDYESAVKYVRQVIDSGWVGGKQLENEVARLKLYEQHKPIRETPIWDE